MRTALLVAVGLLTVTAGCNIFGPSTPTANTTTVDSSGDLVGPGLNNATAIAVERAGSYTFQRNASITTESGRVTRVRTTTRVDFEAPRGLREANQTITGRTITPNVTQAVYTTGDTSYQRQETVQGVEYEVQREGESNQAVNPVNVGNFSRNYTSFTRAFEFEANGTATVAGTETTRYSSVALTDGSVFTDGPNATVVNASATVFVDDEGAVRRLSVAYGVRADNATTRIELTDSISEVGATTVSEPSWVAEAEAAGG